MSTEITRMDAQLAPSPARAPRPAPGAPAAVEAAVPADIDREAYELALRAGAVTRPTVDVVVVTHDSRADLERCLASVEAAARHAGARILVVDNGSRDGSLEYCLGRPAGLVEGIALLANRGYATAVNAAAGCSSADYLVVLNPDVALPDPAAITRLVEHLEAHPAAGAAAPRMLDPDGTAQPSARIVPNLGMLAARQTRFGSTRWGRRSAGRYLRLPRPEGDFACVEWALGAALVVRRRDFDRVGGWDDGFFLYFEDVDFCTRLRRIGRQVHWVPGVTAVHEHHRSSDRANGSAMRSRARRAHFASALRFYAKHPRYAVRGLFGAYRIRRMGNGLRRVADVAVAAATLTLLAPLLALVALAIRLDDGAPVLFRQTRLGKDRRPFTMYKFRTMRVGSERDRAEAEVQRHLSGVVEGELDGTLVYKLWPDPRHTRVGARLRRWSIDELPQLINVLRGEMTLVGFRPPLPEEVEIYPGWYFDRFAIKPGLTGLWQVSGRNERTYEEMVVFDLEYQTRRSLWLDLLLLARTPLVVLTRRGAV